MYTTTLRWNTDTYCLSLVLTPLADCLASLSVQSRPKRRRSKSYYQARRATRAKRKAAVREFAASIGCPISVLTAAISAAALLHLPGFIRAHLRTVRGVRIASEDSISELEIELATSHGTATATFKYGAYVTDPIKLVRILNVTGKPLVIGGDFGGGSTKLGVGCSASITGASSPHHSMYSSASPIGLWTRV